jgi:thioredoxin reductase (NADPH)
MSLESVVIIGAGPAGLSAAIQLKRFGLDPLVLEMDAVGGLLRNANLVENYPGFPGGIPGVELVRLFEDQARSIGVTITPAQVLRVDHDGEGFQIQTDGEGYSARILVVATGTQPRQFTDLIIPNILQDRVFYEVYPLLNSRGKRLAIVGAGDAAFDYGLNLAGRCNEVLILNRGTELKCLPLLWQRAQDETGIQYLENTQIQEIEGIQDGLRLRCASLKGEVTLQVDYLLGAIGREPCLDMISPRLQQQAQWLQSQGLLYFIGDVKNGIYRQTSISIGDGVKAAMQISGHYETKKLNVKEIAT